MQSSFVVLKNGSRIHYVSAGDAKNPPIIFLHGFPTDWRLWRLCIPKFTERYFICAPDLPGHGLSEQRPDNVHDLDYYIEFVKLFMEALGLSKAHFVVHDLGALVGLGFTGTYPERVDRLVVMDTAPYPSIPLIMKMAFKLLAFSPIRSLLLTKTGFSLFLYLFTTRNPEVVRRLVAVYRAAWSDTASQRFMFYHLVSVPIEKLTPTGEMLRRITNPSLVLWAENDPSFSVDLASRLTQDLKDAELVTVPNCGHFVPEEHPRLVAEHVMNFLPS